MPAARAELVIGVPRPRLWGLIATPEGWDRWFTTGAAFEPRIGARYRSSDGDAGAITKLSPPECIAFTWEHPRHPPGSAVSIELREDGMNTFLVLNHTSLPTPELASELQRSWSGVLRKLKAVAESQGE